MILSFLSVLAAAALGAGIAVEVVVLIVLAGIVLLVLSVIHLWRTVSQLGAYVLHE
jgi:hypothetical protein